jgi:hypothetical protein
MKTLYLLMAGSWEENHPVGIFSSEENALKYVKKFNITDNVSIKPQQIDPLSEYVNSDKILYLGKCKKKGKLKLETDNIHEYFKEGSVHFHSNYMYYYFSASNDMEVLEKLENMRNNKLSEKWCAENELEIKK